MMDEVGLLYLLLGSCLTQTRLVFDNLLQTPSVGRAPNAVPPPALLCPKPSRFLRFLYITMAGTSGPSPDDRTVYQGSLNCATTFCETSTVTTSRALKGLEFPFPFSE